MTLKKALDYSTQQLSHCSSTPRLDAELLIAIVNQRPRHHVYSHPEDTLSDAQQQQLRQLIDQRIQGKPMAYIIGQQEFWSLNFKVTTDTLIPRPETEHIIEWVLAHFPAKPSLRLADLGTGSGAIAIAIASERPHWHIDATDQSAAALDVAKENATQLRQRVQFHQGNWCQALPRQDYHLLVANPPYIASDDPHLKQLSYEPSTALIANQQGLAAITHIAEQARECLLPEGYLILEHGCHQAYSVTEILEHNDYQHIERHNDLAGSPRFITAQTATQD